LAGPAASYENPGGMWTPAQMADHVGTLKRLGLAYDPAALTDPTAHPLGAVVSLGGCSASFVSPEGLIVTNHHCVGGALQYNSTPEQNLLEEGFLAATRAEEKWAGPTARVYVTQSFADVSDEVLKGLEAIEDDKARHDEKERRIKQLTAGCEEGKPATRCRIAGYFEGAQYVRIEQLRLKDVRLVYAPHSGIGRFGGETDNWRWPRHTGDFAFLRAYVGKDGQPAEHAADNVPYKPARHLEIAKTGLKKGDLVMVAGYPGRTHRMKTADEVQEAADWYYPYRIELYQQYIAVLEKATKGRPDAAIKAAGRLRGLNNGLTNARGMLDGLTKGGLAQERTKLEEGLRTWIDQDPERKKKYGSVLADMEWIRGEQRKTRVHDTAVGELARGSALLGVARSIVRLAEQRQKPDAERDRGYQGRDRGRRTGRMMRMSKSYDAQVDRAVFKMYLMRAIALPEEERPKEVLEILVGEGEIDEAKIDAALDRFYKATKLGDEKVRVRLIEKGDPAKLARSRDPFIKAAIELRPLMEKMEERDERADGALTALRPRYVEALREYTEGSLPPDANGTLRITYGTVRGYRPKPDAEVYEPFTTLSEMADKHTGKDPFNAPGTILATAAAKEYGPYLVEEIGDVPLDFLSDLDITGGNSGSATLDSRGDLVGLVFDGNYESMASDWLFIPEITRSIHVDARYMLWVMDAVDQADHLLEEMGVTPVIGNAPEAEGEAGAAPEGGAAKPGPKPEAKQ
jgi:hypothetical protein